MRLVYESYVLRLSGGYQLSYYFHEIINIQAAYGHLHSSMAESQFHEPWFLWQIMVAANIICASLTFRMLSYYMLNYSFFSYLLLFQQANISADI